MSSGCVSELKRLYADSDALMEGRGVGQSVPEQKRPKGGSLLGVLRESAS
jgi:hypothetical protein